MEGKNLFENYKDIRRLARSYDHYCVFISHRSDDKAMARAVSRSIRQMGIDVYFDEYDHDLQNASAADDHKKIVECIERGLETCTHLLGVITHKTFDSWWVPYEIGGASGRKRSCAHLVQGSVTQLPSYVRISPLLISIPDLERWLKPLGQMVRKGMVLEEISFSEGDKILLSEYVPKTRSLYDISFKDMP
ncbi:MAG TPA: toll/interleukin-1 receptor domain-containing protein [Acidobacteriota bacterium]|nr:toll/interleukin-1 receptor domain-containing protein [Acidobacteriota bacterium]HNT16957.1 toll/interleukin-1 receptor domain-containing protein [Acidobacteriota bacterium]